MAQKKGLLIANGEIDCHLLKQFYRQKWDKIIAADGGALNAISCGIKPDVVIGDLDSVKELYEDNFLGLEFIHRPSQELNDLEKALQYCREIGLQKLVLFGITGKRMDHAINNFSVLMRYLRYFEMEVYDRFSRILWAGEFIEFEAEIGQTVSLIPLGRVEGITTRGLKYALTNEALEFGIREGLSNQVVESPVQITVAKGNLLVFINWPERYD
jgi:thiamine pyrophosphokinase